MMKFYRNKNRTSRGRRAFSRRAAAHFAALLAAFLKGALAGLLAVSAVCFILLAGYTFLYKSVGPDPALLDRPVLPESSKIYSRDGTLLYEIYKEYKRTPVRLDEMSMPLQQAVIAAEDKDFYTHLGISFSGIARSALLDTAQQDFSYGGSTITQQLIKAYVMPKEKTLSRKVAEAVWAIEVERRFSKPEILEMYLNSAPFGRNAYGAEAAAQAYFGKRAVSLTIAESAYLAAMPNAPARLSPDGGQRQDLDIRKDKILRLMLEQGYLSQPEFEKALAEKVKFIPAQDRLLAPHFVFWIKQQLEKKYGEEKVYEGGLKVVTTLDLSLQELAEKAVAGGAAVNQKKYNAHNAALVAVEPRTGQVLAMAGSKNYFGQVEPPGCIPGKNCLFEPNANVATSLRQPGSSFKPYVYATAFDRAHALNPGSVVVDAVRNFAQPGSPPYIPRNYNGAQYGRVSLRKALAGSLNVATVNLASQIGVDDIIAAAGRFGLNENFERCGLALALGSCEISLLEHTAGIAGIANEGLMNPAAGILKITDKAGNILEEYKNYASQAADSQAAYEVISIMKDSKAREYIFGKNPPLTLPDREAIAKTGTTQDWKDGWTLGAIPQLAAGVWVGNNDGALMAKGADGVFVAAPIWHNFMLAAESRYAVETFPVPEGVQEIKINPYTGVLPKTGQRTVTEISADFAVPKPPAPTPQKPVIIEEPEDNFDYESRPAVFVSPLDGQWVPYSDLRVSAEAEIQNGTRASLFLDGTLIGNMPGPFFSWTIPASQLEPGRHRLRLLAVNQAGYRSETEIVISVVE